jgi:C-terminal processing protease CtpA/Prc
LSGGDDEKNKHYDFLTNHSMMKTAHILAAFFIAFSCYSQVSNYDFEEKDPNYEEFGSDSYQISIDSTVAYSGRSSALIEFIGDTPEYKSLSFAVPADFVGRKLQLTGYIKTENVHDGYAGLWCRIDPNVVFRDMRNNGVTGTTEWKKFKVLLPYNDDAAEKIVFGAILRGKGKMWIDELSITCNGKSLDKATPKKLLPADEDHEFDDGSNITIHNWSSGQLSDLKALGKIWGFLKYHHPEIAKGNYNWDYELFRILPELLAAASQTSRDEILVKWIDQLGDVEKCKDCKDPNEEAYLKPDLEWITNSGFSKALEDKLWFIYKNRNQKSNYYIGMANRVGNPVFKHEATYANMPFPDDGFRLLAVYKFWNAIEYFFPSKYLIEKNWDEVLEEYIPKFLGAKNELEYELAAIQLIGEIQDTHANLWGGKDAIREWMGDNYASFYLRFIEDKLVVTGYYNPELQEDAGMEIGDIITEVNGKSIAEIIEEKTPIYPASNYPTMLRDLSKDILRSQDSVLNIEYQREGDIANANIILYPSRKLNLYTNKTEGDPCYKMLDDSIGYITLKNIKAKDIDDIKKSLRDAKGIIVDIRNYPSTFVVFTLGNFLVDKPTPFVKFTGGNVKNPGEFTFGPLLRVGQTLSNGYHGKVVILVNEFTQSQAEYTTMAFRVGENATVVGSTTAGADGNISQIHLPGGLRTMISGLGVYYPDGTRTQQIGIVPDIEVTPTIKGIKEGRDELMEKAIELINQ